MSSRARLDWRGDKLVADLRRAVEDSIDETVDAARDDATLTHPWKVDPRYRRFRNIKHPINPHLEAQIQSEHVVSGSAVPTGRFGYTRRRGFYGLFLEFRFPTIRPAGDRVFPTLAARIRRRLSL